MKSKDTVLGTIKEAIWDFEFFKEQQAEVSFKAGIQEVIDFIGQPFEHNYFRHGVNGKEVHDINDCFACKFEDKLKEWGVEIKK